MSTHVYTPLTAGEVAKVLAITDCDELAGERIADDMLNGLVEFTEDEVTRLAAYKGICYDELSILDPRFKRYAKKERLIAKKLIDKGFDAEFAAEICGLDVVEIRKNATSAGK